MKAIVKKNYNPEVPNEFAGFTTHGKECKAPNKYWFSCEHSPIRMFRYVIQLLDVKTFVSVHLVRHGKFAEHAVMSKRDDLRPDKDEKVDRNTPVNHMIETNAQELINISRKRLCYKSSKETVATWKKVCNQVKEVEPQLYPYLVPECAYRNGICPEPRMCNVGIVDVMKAYDDYPMLPKNRSK